jgi:hypothetical protein
MEELITKRVIGPLQGFRSKLGRPFAAMVKLTPEFKLEFDFGQNDKRTDGGGEEVDFTGKEPVGKCPKCGARVFENGMNYVCEKAVGPVAPATSDPAQSFCSSRWIRRRFPGCSPPGKRNSCPNSFRKKPAGRSRPSWRWQGRQDHF